jgi:hypothetical protein
LHTSLPPPAERPDPVGPRDDPFLEKLFAALCEQIFVLRGETFFDQANRWTHVLDFMASLGPRKQPEWLLAADVTLKQFRALHSLTLYRAKGVTSRQRLKHGRDFIARAKGMQDAMVNYELLRNPRAV